MADQHLQGQETNSCGMFDFLGKKEKNPQEDAVMTDSNMAQMEEPYKKKEGHKPTLEEELHHSQSDSSSSSDVEGGGGEKKRKKKGLKEKIKDKMLCHGDEVTEQKNSPAFEKHDEVIINVDTTHPEECKGIFQKIKDKLPGQHTKDEAEGAPAATIPEGEQKEKKGIFDKIKEKLPGHHNNGEEEKKKDN